MLSSIKKKKKNTNILFINTLLMVKHGNACKMIQTGTKFTENVW